ncbi:helix-turn-helix transcriptional regulator [Sphingobacterium bovistauri]|uniref:YafY family transcriptional regulator n=1 Tax=Sphingobacterium bovistauri TaxID=2781959 RepID=A0ABS7Z0Q4_9SPHI|nr:YafY family protein [Sphingobacterium bovistauri]MCA5003706.1 YafY family transcriptional regulator [Sphingobacterium bovistauri]
MDITKRFDRLLGIYFYLQSKPLVKAQDLADKYEVSLRTIYRDIKALEHAGVPIMGEAGYGYSLMHTYKIQPINFTEQEALSFGVAEKLMEHYLDKEIGQHFTNALLKMKGVLRFTDKENVADLESKVLINKEKHFLNENVPAALATLFESMVKRKQIHLKYKSVESNSQERNIEVIGVFQEGQFWYFMAYCHLRHEVRQFRLDRIEEIRLIDLKHTQEFLPLQTYLSSNKKEELLETVRIWVSKDMSRYLHWERQFYGFKTEEEKDNGVEMLFHTSQLEHFARWFMMFADEAIIYEPQRLKDSVHHILQNAIGTFEDYALSQKNGGSIPKPRK